MTLTDTGRTRDERAFDAGAREAPLRGDSVSPRPCQRREAELSSSPPVVPRRAHIHSFNIIAIKLPFVQFLKTASADWRFYYFNRNENELPQIQFLCNQRVF